MEQQPPLHWRERELRFLIAYYKAIIEAGGVAEGPWKEFYKERQKELEDEFIRNYPEQTT